MRVVPRKFDSNRYRRPTNEYEQRALDILGDAIYEGRRRLGVTQRELAEWTATPQSTISRLERRIAPGTTVRRLAGLIVVLGGVSFGSPVRPPEPPALVAVFHDEPTP